jgi:hypothetical protein
VAGGRGCALSGLKQKSAGYCYTVVNIGDEGHLISTYFQPDKRGYISCVSRFLKVFKKNPAALITWIYLNNSIISPYAVKDYGPLFLIQKLGSLSESELEFRP